MIEMEADPKEEHDRMTIVVRTYHQRLGKDAVGVDRGYSRVLLTKSQTYDREITIGETAEDLDLGWIKEPSLVVIENLVGKTGRKVIPSKEELLDEAGRIIEVIFGESEVPGFLVPPGLAQPFLPAPGTRLRLRCRHETADLRIVALPK